MQFFETAEAMGHEQVLHCFDKQTGLRAIIAIHDSRLGSAMGATRLYPYADTAAALKDALRLSRGMTYKAACAGIPVGGAKAVIIADPAQKTPAMLRAYARFVDKLGGLFVTGQDMNLTPDDVRIMATVTEHVVGMEERGGGPGPLTARGVFAGLKAAVRHRFSSDDLVGLRVAVQGLGAVGANLCRRLHEVGASLVVTDVREAQCARMAELYGASIVAPEAIYGQDADIFAPCALGGTLNVDTIPQLKAKVVSGAANNQLGDEVEDGARLSDRGILYAPDYVINAGGILNVYHEKTGYNDAHVLAQIDGIGATLAEIFLRADASGITTHEASMQLATHRIERALEKQQGPALFATA